MPMGGIEPPSELYEGSALPLSYTGKHSQSNRIYVRIQRIGIEFFHLMGYYPLAG